MIDLYNFLISLVSLIELYYFCFYLPTKYYKNKMLAFISLFVGVFLQLFFQYQNISAVALGLFSLNSFVGIIGLLTIGLIIGFLLTFLVFDLDMYTKLHDGGIVNGIRSGIITWRYKDKNKKLVEEKNKLVYCGVHSAAIVAIKKGLLFDDDSVFADGIDLLSKYFKKKHIPFQIYVCKTPDEARQVIKNDKVNKIWIFGHGAMYGLYFGKNGLLNYKEFISAPKNKDFIGQFHCNSHSECGYSLADLILSSDGKKFVKEGYRTLNQNRVAIEEGINKNWNCED